MAPTSRLTTWKQRARQLETEAHALYLAYRDPRVPWYARLYAAFVVGYILSPIDPIPDFIPLVGYLDELLLLPVFVALARRMIPAEVLAEHRATAQSATFGTRRHWIAAAVIVSIWIVVAVGAAYLVVRLIEFSLGWGTRAEMTGMIDSRSSTAVHPDWTRTT